MAGHIPPVEELRYDQKNMSGTAYHRRPQLGLVGLFRFDCVGWLLGGTASIFSRIVFTIVGLAALVAIPMLFERERPEQPGRPDGE